MTAVYAIRVRRFRPMEKNLARAGITEWPKAVTSYQCERLTEEEFSYCLNHATKRTNLQVAAAQSSIGSELPRRTFLGDNGRKD